MKILVTIDDKDFYFNNAELTMSATDDAMNLVVQSVEENRYPDHTTYRHYTGACRN